MAGVSGDISPLAVYAPDLYLKQMQLQRAQAYAQALQEQGLQSPGNTPYGGLASAAKSLAGALLGRQAMDNTASLYQGMSAPGGSNPGQVSNAAGADASSGAPPPTAATGSAPIPDVAPSTPAPQPQQPQAQMQQGTAPGTTIPGTNIPLIPGMDPRQAWNYFLTNPAGYQAEWAKNFEQTDTQKNTAAAYGAGTPQYQTYLKQLAQKNIGENLRPGGGIYVPGQGLVAAMPNSSGVNSYQMPDGQIGQQMAPGAEQALAQSGYASAAGAAALKPHTGWTATGQPIPSNELTMSGNAGAFGIGAPQPAPAAGQQPLGIRTNNPGNLQPGGQQASFSTPTAGILAASANLDAYAKQGINTISGIVGKWAPQTGGNNTQAYVADVAQRLGVNPNQPLNLQDHNVKGALLEAMFQHENGNKFQAPSQGQQQSQGALMPELMPGQANYMQAQAKDAADRHDAAVAAAAESPMRINVLDNIIDLSSKGVATGPGQDWQQSILGYAANTPVLAKLMGSQQSDVAKFQELQKFTYQNAIRNWQVAGGTGTDNQMAAMSHANPNDHLFPQALQAIAKWGKASELAIQGKANAQDQFLGQNGQTPANQIKFESTWRNAFDPKVFQYSLMNPQEKQAFAAQQLKTPQAAKAFLAKQQQLQALGALPQ